MSKVIAILGGMVGIMATFLAFFEPSLGWWEAIGPLDQVYINAFGVATSKITDNTALMEPILILLGGVLFLLGSLLIIYTAIKESKGGAFLSAVLMLIGIALWCYGLTTLTGLEQVNVVISLLMAILTSGDYSIFWGEYSLWTWRLGNGLFIAIAGAVISLIGSFYVKR